VAKAAGQAAVAGAAVGFVLDRRDRRKRSRLLRAQGKANLSGVVAGAGALADMALPALHTASEFAQKKGSEAAKAAKPKLEAAADAARPHVLAAADVAREKGSEAARAARPHVEHATDLAKARAQTAREAAKAKLSEYDLPVVIAV
jgi:high-affinity Fe2+/Pb2+ permease